MPTDRFLADLQARNLVHSHTPAVEAFLRAEPRVGYIGVDPTGPNLHIGHLATLLQAARFQQAGHHPILLVGGATGMVGDPSGKSAERNLLTLEQVRYNSDCIRQQMEAFLVFDSSVPNPARMANNYDWFGPMPILDFLRDIGKHFTVNYMLGKESVSTRMATGLSFTEFSYQLLQAYDFLELNRRFGCTVQMGGSDQWGNITAGLELIRKLADTEAHGVTFPLVMRADGQKFGKTADGQNVWLNAELTSPYAFYQFWVNVEDADIGRMMRHYSLRPLEDIEDTLAAGKAAPEARIAQRALAEELTTFVHGSAELAGIQRATDLLFGKGSAQDLRALSPEQLRTLAQAVPHTVMPTSLVTAGTRLLQLFVQSQLLPSNSEARRAFAQGGLKVNKEPLPSESEVLAGAHLLHSRFLLLQKGKREYHLVEFQG